MTYTEEVVAQQDDLKNGEMKQVLVGETDVLLVRHDNRFYALHAYCSHYGAALANGALSDGRIICPWHHACFDAASGDQIEPPGLDSLDTYHVEFEGQDIVVRVPDEPGGHRIVDLAHRSDIDTRTFVVLGGGAAGEYAVEALRRGGFLGRVLMITKEAETPYDRPNCSKEYLMGEAPEEWMFLRSADFYDEYDIERMHETTVSELDAESKTLTLEDGRTIPFDGIVLCTGGIPNRLDIPGADLGGVYTLRSMADSREIMQAGRSSLSAVVVGASFIGMEVAYSLKVLGVEEVTVIAPGKVPFAKPFGERVGMMVKDIHEENEVRFRLGHTVKEFQGTGLVERVLLDDGSTIEADLVVVGVGVHPATDFIKGLDKADDASIIVDETLQAAPGIYAAGDIATFPDWRTGRQIRVEHWRLACQHGRLAGTNLARTVSGTGAESGTGTESGTAAEPDKGAGSGKGAAGKPYRSIPYFWTVHFGTSIRYVGHIDAWDEIIYHGSPEERKFIAFYVKGDDVLAAAGTNCDTEMSAIEELMRRERMPTVIDLKRGEVDYVARLND